MITQDEFLKLPLIVLKGLENNVPAQPSTLQTLFLPFLPTMQMMWWLLFFGVLVVLGSRFLILPLATGNRQPAANHLPVTDAVALLPADGEARTFLERCRRFYIRLFSIEEIARDTVVRLFGGAILLGYMMTYNRWQMNRTTTLEGLRDGNSVCWPFFTHCRSLIWMHALPEAYSQTIMFMAMFGLIVLGAYALLARRVVLAHACILVLFLFKVYLTLIMFDYNGNYDYYHTLYSIVFLFLPYKRFFASFMAVYLYFLSTATKIHPSWVWGGYFNSLKTGLPMIPRGIELFLTNFVIFMEMIMGWFMLGRRVWLQRTVFAFFCFFHLYSGILVGYLYPSIVMPPLVILFGPLFQPFGGVPLTVRSVPGWTLAGLLLGIQLFSHLLPSDPKLTMEGNYYGLYMFEANHQCRVTFTGENGNVLYQKDSTDARFRCNPWEYLSYGKNRYCGGNAPAKIHFTMIHSINGGPFYQIVDEADLCSLTYEPFADNGWIRNDTTAPAVGRPMENFYR